MTVELGLDLGLERIDSWLEGRGKSMYARAGLPGAG